MVGMRESWKLEALNMTGLNEEWLMDWDLWLVGPPFEYSAIHRAKFTYCAKPQLGSPDGINIWISSSSPTLKPSNSMSSLQKSWWLVAMNSSM